jgi:hypothetical protein
MGNYLSSLKTFSRKPLSSENIVSQDSSSFANTSGTLSTAVSTSLTNSNKSESNSKVKAKKKEKSANTSKMSVILQPTIKQTASVNKTAAALAYFNFRCLALILALSF